MGFHIEWELKLKSPEPGEEGGYTVVAVQV